MEIVEKDLPQLIVALDSLNDDANYVHILDAKENTNYYCPCCKGIVKPRAYKKDKSYQVQAHYYHETGGCNEETFVHYICKTWLFERGCKFIVNNVQYEVENIDIEKTLHTSFGDYRPDIIVTTTVGKIFYFEIKTTNKKTELYAPKWDELGNDVVEVDTRYFINQKYKNDIPVFNLIYSDGECFIKNYSRNDYEDIIAKRKLEWKRQDKLNYKIKWEQLDWFWEYLQDYYACKCNIDVLCNQFSKLDFSDQKFICSKLNSTKHKRIKYELENYYSDASELEKVRLNHISNMVRKLNKEFGLSSTYGNVYLFRKGHNIIFKNNQDWTKMSYLFLDYNITENDVYKYFYPQMEAYVEKNKIILLKQKEERLKNEQIKKERNIEIAQLRKIYDPIFENIKEKINTCQNRLWRMSYSFIDNEYSYYYQIEHYRVNLCLAKYWDDGWVDIQINDIKSETEKYGYQSNFEQYIIDQIQEEMSIMLKSAFSGKRTVRLMEKR